MNSDLTLLEADTSLVDGSWYWGRLPKLNWGNLGRILVAFFGVWRAWNIKMGRRRPSLVNLVPRLVEVFEPQHPVKWFRSGSQNGLYWSDVGSEAQFCVFEDALFSLNVKDFQISKKSQPLTENFNCLIVPVCIFALEYWGFLKV